MNAPTGYLKSDQWTAKLMRDREIGLEALSKSWRKSILDKNIIKGPRYLSDIYLSDE